MQYVKGVGPRRAESFARLGIHTIRDLLEYAPARLERQEQRTITNLELGIVATVIGRIESVRVVYGRNGPTTRATLVDNTGRCGLCWFHGGWVAQRLTRGTIVQATGKVQALENRAHLINPRFTRLADDAAPADERAAPNYVPVYAATADLPNRFIADLIEANLETWLQLVVDPHDEAYRKRRDLLPLAAALRTLHRPADEARWMKARRRLVYDKLLLLQLWAALSRSRRAALRSAGLLRCNAEIDRRIRRRFPFPLTEPQNRAIAEIVRDLGKPSPMNRLLQGDVGCGKTVVALYAMLVAVANKFQTALVAPTEVLAEQHHRSMLAYLDGSRVRHALLTGAAPAAKRREILADLRDGRIDLVVGTHALVQQGVKFAKLALVVIDEQHRFGVRQRAAMREKGPSPHYLVMTATPIPRTLAMTTLGDLDITTIDGSPPGRQPVHTSVIGPAGESNLWDFVREHLRQGRQAYVVYPIIDASDRLEMRAATTEFRRLRDTLFAGWPIGLLHGRMNPDQRREVMEQFAAGKLALLAATTVIEVGIDVPNATCIVVHHAERYGLSQLHQLRGRVGRGTVRGYCFLMSANPAHEENQRLAVLTRTQDGFRIAEEDLRLRGPGDVMGLRQHGLPDETFTAGLADVPLIRQAQADAQALVAADPALRVGRHAALRQALLARHRRRSAYLGVG